jgi:4-diphosphocytidyl-2-C-methyl-D-erythritol kinase
MIRELAPAKVNLILRVGRRRADGLHELASLFARIDLADEVTVEPSRAERDEVICPGVPGRNLAEAALEAYRAQLPASTELPPLTVTIEKRIPVAAGLGGGSADAAAALRAANRLAGEPRGPDDLRAIAASVGSDVPSQLEPGHALVSGAGETVEPVDLQPATLVLLPDGGLSTAEVYAEADRLGATRSELGPESLRAIAALSPEELARRLENDLQSAAVSLRPELGGRLGALRDVGALGALVAGSGPTVFGLFADRAAAVAAAERLQGSLLATLDAP